MEIVNPNLEKILKKIIKISYKSERRQETAFFFVVCGEVQKRLKDRRYGKVQ
jgi:hypothetical protein